MEELVGLLRIRVKRGINLAQRDTLSSDPFVVITMGSQVFSLSISVFDSNLIWSLWISSVFETYISFYQNIVLQEA